MSVQPQQPTVPGKVDGIIAMNPCVLQCRVCGTTVTQDRPSLATLIILAGFQFHLCAERSGVRMCPSCLSAAKSACGSSRCADA